MQKWDFKQTLILYKTKFEKSIKSIISKYLAAFSVKEKLMQQNRKLENSKNFFLRANVYIERLQINVLIPEV